METGIMAISHQQIIDVKKTLDTLDKDKAIKIFSYFLIYEERLSQKTLEQYYYQIKSFFAWCEVNNLLPWKATKDDINQYIIYLSELAVTKQGNHLAPATINARLIAVKRFFEALKEREYIAENPAKKVKGVKEHSLAVAKMKCLDSSMIPIKQLLDAAAKHPHKTRNQAAIVLMGFLGLRSFEVCLLKCKDIDDAKKSILIHGKGNKNRITGMSDIQFQYIKALLDTRPNDPEAFLFVSESPRKSKENPHLSARGLRYMIDSLMIETGLKKPRLSNHSLRHTCGVNLAKNGYSLDQIAKLLGHSDINTTKVYTDYLDLVANPISASLDQVFA